MLLPCGGCLLETTVLYCKEPPPQNALAEGRGSTSWKCTQPAAGPRASFPAPAPARGMVVPRDGIPLSLGRRLRWCCEPWKVMHFGSEKSVISWGLSQFLCL